MALVLKNILKFYNEYFVDHVDPRIAHLPFTTTPWSLIAILSAYLYFVNDFGRNWMKNRKAFELKTIINIYNLAQVAVNSYLVVLILIYVPRLKDFKLFCIPDPRGDNSEEARQILYGHYIYLVIKVTDLLDTVFFILRKKNNQATFLHIYHHALMAAFTYLHLKFVSGGGHACGLGLVNSFVHTVMYGYYFLTSYKPELKNSIWWKKHITQLQLLQFTLFTIHFSVPLFTACTYPKVPLVIGLLQNIFMTVLFSDFYYKAYIKKKPSKQE